MIAQPIKLHGVHDVVIGPKTMLLTPLTKARDHTEGQFFSERTIAVAPARVAKAPSLAMTNHRRRKAAR